MGKQWERTEQQSISYSSFSAIEMNLFNRSQNACPDILASNCSIDPEPKLPPQAEDPSNRKTLPVYNHNGDIVTKGIHPDGESGRRGFHPLHFFTVGWRSSSKVSLAVNVLWPFVPAGLAIHFARPDLHVWIFAINYIAMVPAANLVGFAGQQLARKLPKVTGILLETALGSVVEIVLFMVLIKKSGSSNSSCYPWIHLDKHTPVLRRLLFHRRLEAETTVIPRRNQRGGFRVAFGGGLCPLNTERFLLCPERLDHQFRRWRLHRGPTTQQYVEDQPSHIYYPYRGLLGISMVQCA